MPARSLASAVALLLLAALPAFAQAPAVSPAPSTAPAAATPLTAALTALEQDPIFSSAKVGIEVVNATTGQVVYSKGASEPMLPASTMKLVTSAVALKQLKPTYRFSTWVMTDGKVSPDGELDGNLYIRGGGDPTMVVETLWKLVMDIRLRGIQTVKGDLVFDDSFFGGGTRMPGWENQGEILSGVKHTAPVSALSLNYNWVSLLVRPGESVGHAAAVESATPSWAVKVENKASTRRSGSKTDVWLKRDLDDSGRTATYTVDGVIAEDAEPETVVRAVADPVYYYMGAFETIAKGVGLKVKGTYRQGATPTKNTTKVVRADSETLTEVLMVMNKLSNNFFAEQVLRTVAAEKRGAPGTTENGAAVISDYFQSLGAAPGTYTVVNGSGLSRGGRITPSLMNKVLLDMYQDPSVGPEFLQTLAVGGRDGTLWSRFRGEDLAGRVRAKTGTLDGVACLAGYVRAKDGQTYVFSFFVNDLQGSLSRARRAHDRLVVALAGTQTNLIEAGGDNEASQ